MSIAEKINIAYTMQLPRRGLRLILFEDLSWSKMATPQRKKESLSRAYVRAIAAKVGASVSETDHDFGIDLTLKQIITRTKTTGDGNRYIENGAAVDIQIKCSENITVTATEVSHVLEAESFNDLVDPNVNTPRILVVLKVPNDEAEWLTQSSEELVIRNCAYWVSLKGQPATKNTDNKTIKIPAAQKFTPEAILGFFEKIKTGDDL